MVLDLEEMDLDQEVKVAEEMVIKTLKQILEEVVEEDHQVLGEKQVVLG